MTGDINYKENKGSIFKYINVKQVFFKIRELNRK